MFCVLNHTNNQSNYHDSKINIDHSTFNQLPEWSNSVTYLPLFWCITVMFCCWRCCYCCWLFHIENMAACRWYFFANMLHEYSTHILFVLLHYKGQMRERFPPITRRPFRVLPFERGKVALQSMHYSISVLDDFYLVLWSLPCHATHVHKHVWCMLLHYQLLSILNTLSQIVYSIIHKYIYMINKCL